MSEVQDGEDASREETTEIDYPSVLGDRTTADVVRACEEGDHVSFCRGSREGDIRWSHEFVTDAGDDWVEFGSYRLEVVDDDELARFCRGDEGVLVRRDGVGYPRDQDSMPSASGIERIPSEALESEQWYEWEVGVSETRGFEAVSTDQNVLVQAPDKETAVETAKRRARMESGYEQVCYREGELEAPSNV